MSFYGWNMCPHFVLPFFLFAVQKRLLHWVIQSLLFCHAIKSKVSAVFRIWKFWKSWKMVSYLLNPLASQFANYWRYISATLVTSDDSCLSQRSYILLKHCWCRRMLPPSLKYFITWAQCNSFSLSIANIKLRSMCVWWKINFKTTLQKHLLQFSPYCSQLQWTLGEW